MSKSLDPNVLASIWAEVRSELERKKRLVYEEIRHYPPPITACDEQFDQLLAMPRTISRELDRLHAASQVGLANPDPVRTIDKFLSASTCIDDLAKQRIESLLAQAVSKPGR